MTRDDELAAIMQRMNGPFFPQICTIAAQYVREKLSPDELSPKSLELSNTQTIVASSFIRACQDFLLRDNKPKAANYQRKAETLRAALDVLQKEMRFFESLMVGVDDPYEATTIDAPAGQPGPIRIESRSARQALWAIDKMASAFEGTAADVGKDPKNISLFHCLKRMFGDHGQYYYRDAPLPLPTNEQTLALYEVLRNAVKDAGLSGRFVMPQLDLRQAKQLMGYKPR